MRRILFLLVAALLALPAAAQNVDIEALSGLQFNFANPGARSLGMGGAFLGLADDASAAEANPAGLTILRKPEISLEVRNYAEAQLLTTSGTFPEVNRTEFINHSDAAVISFGSFVYPIKKFTLGVYYHEPLHNKGSGFVAPSFNEITGQLESRTPNFFLPTGGGAPISEQRCTELRRTNPAACTEYRIDPFVTAVDVQQRTFGLAGAWQVHPKFSIGANARYQQFQEAALTFRFTQQFDPAYILAQATGDTAGEDIDIKQENDLTFGVGFKYAPTDKLSFGGVYKQGPQFDSPTFFASGATGWEYLRIAETKFHMPDTAGLGVSFRPRPELTINADAVHVKYSNLVDDFVPIIVGEELRSAFVLEDVTELHLGAEYFFPTKIPFALRGGYWYDPKHSIEWQGPMTDFEHIAEAMLYPEGQDQHHFSIGAGIALPRFQIDIAYDSADLYKVGSISFVTRF